MDQRKKMIMETGFKELLKHLTGVQQALDKQFKHLAIAQQELDELVQLCGNETNDDTEKIYAISAKVLNGSLPSVCDEKIFNVTDKNDDKNPDIRKRKGVMNEVESSKRWRRQTALRTDTSSSEEDPRSSDSESERSEKRYGNERKRNDGDSPSKNKRPCMLCRSESHHERNCPNVNTRCFECHKLGHAGMDCTIRKRRLAYESRNHQRISKFKYRHSKW